MAQFISKQDYFGLADGTMLVCISSDEGRSAEVAEAKGADGSIVETHVYAEKLSPSNSYAMKHVSFIKSLGEIKIGGVTTIEGKSICLNNFQINTQAGSAPSISASGEQIEDDTVQECTYSIPAFQVNKQHHAFILWDCCQVAGLGVHIQSASYTCSASISKATKDGECLSHDVTEGKIECTIELLQTGNAEPTVTPGDGWVMTSPPTQSNPDSDWPSWSCTLTKYLEKDI